MQYYISNTYDDSQFSIKQIKQEDCYDMDVEITPMHEVQYVKQYPVQSYLNLDFCASTTQEVSNNQSNVDIQKKYEKYMLDINQILIKKYDQIKQQSSEQESDFENKEQTKIKKKKIIKKKTINKQNKFLNEKLNECRKHLTRLWTNRIFLFLKDKLEKYHISAQLINCLKKKISKARISIIELVSILKHNPWINKIILKEEKEFLQSIYDSSLSDQSKFTLFQTYDILTQGLREPDSLKTWDYQQKKNSVESRKIYEKFNNKNYLQIVELAQQQYQKRKNQFFSKNKCSIHNNLTYFWSKYIKDIIQDQFFGTSFCNYADYTKLCNLIFKAPSLNNIKSILSIKWFANYIKQQKIDTKQILKEILLNNKVNILNKLNMIISLNILTNAIEQPTLLKGWFK